MTSPGDSVLLELLELIGRHGWAVRHVGGDTANGHAPFSYTVGLTAMGHPEIVTTGLPFEHAQTFLNEVGADVRDGRRFAAGTTTGDFTSDDAPVCFLDVVDTSGLTAVEQVYDDVEALQLVWPDSAGHLPWDAGYRNPADAQPILGPGPV